MVDVIDEQMSTFESYDSKLLTSNVLKTSSRLTRLLRQGVDSARQVRVGERTDMNTQSRSHGMSMIVLAAMLILAPIASAPIFAQSKGSTKKAAADKKKRAKPATRRPTTKRGSSSIPKKNAVRATTTKKDSGQKVVIPKDVQKQIDEMMTKPVKRVLDPKARREARQRAEKRRASRRPVRKTPASSVARRRSPSTTNRPGGDRTSSGESDGVAIDIPPSEPGVPAEQRQYSFSIKHGSYQQLIEALARQTGLAVRGEAPSGDDVTFVTEEVLNFDELLKRVRLLLFEYKTHDPYWLLRYDTHLEVLRLADFVRERLGPELIYRSLEDFVRRHPPDDDLAYVLYTPKSGSLADQEFLRDLMPDYMRFTPLEKSNTAAIFGLVRDIRKYLDYVDIFTPVIQGDPRTLELIPVNFITPTEAYDKLGALMKLESVPGKSVRTVRRAKPGGALEGVPEPEVSVMPEDAQGVLIVRAMQDKIEEIKKLLAYVDVDTTRKFLPVVVEVKHGEPEALIDTIQQILNPAVQRTTAPKRLRKLSGRGIGGAGRAAAPDLTLIPHPAGHAIVVLAKDEDLARVRKLISQFDISTEVGPIRISLKHVQADAILPTITKLIGGATAIIPRSRPGKIRSASSGSQVVASESGDALWYTGSQQDLDKVRALLVEMDVEKEPILLHIIRLENQKPSFVAQMLNEYEGGGSGTTPVRRLQPGIKKLGRRASSVGGNGGPSFTADDEQGRLFVLCTDTKWKELLSVIQELESEITEVEFQLVGVEHISPADAVEKLTALVFGTKKIGLKEAESGLRLEATDHGVLVMGASAAEMATIRGLLQEFDKPTEIVQRIFEIKYADPADVKEAVEALLIADTSISGSRPKSSRGLPRKVSTGRGPRASSSDGLTIVQIDDRLVVKGKPGVVKEVGELILEFDVDRSQRDMRTYTDFQPGTDLEEFVDTLEALMGTANPKARKSLSRANSSSSAKDGAPRFIPQPAARKLIVMAKPVQFPRIEQFIKVLRRETTTEPTVVEFVRLKHAAPEDVIALVEPILDMKVRERLGLNRTGRSMKSAAVKVAPQVRRSKHRRGGDAELFQLSADGRNKRIIISATQAIIDDAKLLIAEFDIPPDRAVAKRVEFIDVQHAEPETLIEAIKPILNMKINELVEQGELSQNVRAGSGIRAMPRKVVRSRGSHESSERFHLYADIRQNRIVIVAAPVVIKEARELIKAFDLPGSGAEMPVVEIVSIVHGEPSAIVEKIEPLLSLKVRALEAGGGSGASKPVSNKPAVQRLQKMNRSNNSTTLNYHLEPDDRNKQIVIAAPPTIVEQAKALIALFDKSSLDDIVFETIVLTHANPVEMVEAINGLMSGSSVANSRSPKTRKLGKPTAIPRPVIDGSFSAVVAPGGGALVLQGTRSDVDRAKTWIARLDDMAVPGVVIKVYEIKRAPMETLVELIMHQVNVSQHSSTAVAGGNRSAGAVKKADDEQDAFTTTITRTSGDVYLRADLIDHTIVVSAPPAIVASIDAVVARVDPPDSDEPLIDDDAPRVPKLVYELKYTDAYDASEDLDMVLKALWEPSNEIPTVDWGSFGNLLIVRYPYKDRFPEIEELIAKYVDKPKVIKDTIVVLTPPAGASPREFAEWIRRNNSDLDVDIVDVTSDRDETYGVKELHPPKKMDNVNRCVLPASLISSAVAFTESMSVQSKPKRKGKKSSKRSLDDAIREKGRELVSESKDSKKSDGKKSTSESSRDTSRRKGKKLRISIDETTGAVTLEGPDSVIEDAPDWFTEFEEQRKDAPPGPPDIRHFRLRYIDVYSAAEIIEQMFNATRQQRQSVLRAQQQATRQRQQQQLQKQRGSQQKGDQANRQNQQRGRQAPPVQIPQLPPPTVRIQPHPRDRTLIIRASSTQFPAIMKLIATIDQPKPIDRVHRIYQLQHQEAANVEELLRDWLGLDAPVRKRTSGGKNRVGRTRSVGGANLQVGPQLPQTIMERAVTGDDLLGVDPEDISLSSNVTSNSILAMAPKAALDYIGELIADLDVPNAAMDYKSITLMYADAKVVADTLSAMFVGSHQGAGKDQRDSQSPFAFIGDQDGKIVFYRAPERLREKIEEVVSQIEEQSKARTKIHVIKIKFAKPSQVAKALESAYDKAGGGKRGSAKAVSVTPSDSTKQLFVSADDATYAEIESLVQSLDRETSIGFDFRIFPLQYAEARQVHKTMMKLMADFISRLPRDQQESLAAFSAEVDDTANALIVLGGPVVFGFIEDALKRIDVPAAQRSKLSILMVPIKNGDASEIAQSIDRLYMETGDSQEVPPQADANKSRNILIVRGTAEQLEEIQTQFIDPLDKHSLEQLMTATMSVKHIRADEAADVIMQMFDDRRKAVEQASGGGGRSTSPIETTVVVTPDISTNQIIIQASKDNLETIKKRIALLDTPDIAKRNAVTTKVYPLKVADPKTVVQMVKEWTQGNKNSKNGRRKPKRDTILAIADSETRSVVVTASEPNHDRIREMIDSLDDESIVESRQKIQNITLQYADPGSVKEAIVQLFGGSRGKKESVNAVADWNSHSVTVSAPSADLERIESLIAQIDTEGAGEQNVHVIQLDNTDAESVTQTLDEIFVQSAPKPQGNQPPPISIAAVTGSPAILVRSSTSDFERIQSVIDKLDSKELALKEPVRLVSVSAGVDVVDLAQKLESSMNESLKYATGLGSGQQPSISIQADERTSTLIVGGSPTYFDQVEKMARAYEELAPKTGETVRIIQLGQTPADEITRMIDQLKGGKSTGGSARRGGNRRSGVGANRGRSSVGGGRRPAGNRRRR